MYKMFNKYSLILGMIALPCVQQLSARASYIPRDLKQCVEAAHRLASRGKATHLQELDAMINEGRILISESVMRKALNEALRLFENSNSIAYENMSMYMEEYLEGLNNRAIVLSLQGDNQYLSLVPMGLIADAVNAHAKDIDMMRISTEVASRQNLDLSGIADVELGELAGFGSDVPANKASLSFNAAMMTNAVSPTPNMIFGTGVASPSINSWIMSPSGVTRLPAPQSPINIQFMIPADYQKKKPVSLELAFLVSQQGMASGDARIQINAEYMKDGDTFNISAVNPSFTQTITSDDFRITEPGSANSVRYVYVSIPLDKDVIAKHKLALYSLTRIAPHHGHAEYMGNIFLAAATFKYTAKE